MTLPPARVREILEGGSGPMPESCPTCRMSWTMFPPAKIVDHKDGFRQMQPTGQVRCVECKAVYGPFPVPAETVAALCRDNLALREALEDLVRQLDRVHADPRYQSVWTLNQLHGGQYLGPSYGPELDVARAALEEKPA